VGPWLWGHRVGEVGGQRNAELGSCGVTAVTCVGLRACPHWGEEDGSEHPLKQDRFQHFPFHGAHKPHFKVQHNSGTSILAVDGSGFGLKARGELKISCSSHLPGQRFPPDPLYWSPPALGCTHSLHSLQPSPALPPPLSALGAGTRDVPQQVPVAE